MMDDSSSNGRCAIAITIDWTIHNPSWQLTRVCNRFPRWDVIIWIQTLSLWQVPSCREKLKVGDGTMDTDTIFHCKKSSMSEKLTEPDVWFACKGYRRGPTSCGYLCKRIVIGHGSMSRYYCQIVLFFVFFVLAILHLDLIQTPFPSSSMRCATVECNYCRCLEWQALYWTL